MAQPANMSARAKVAQGLKPLVDLVYPPRCPLCGAAIAAQGGLCGDCWNELEFPGDPSCATCQRPMNAVGHSQSKQCRTCFDEPPRHAGVLAATLYNDASRKLVLTFKHGHKIALARLMGRLMAARLPTPHPGAVLPLLVPVPLHRWRLWHRGFNQAGLLAYEIARLGKGELVVDGLQRPRRTPSLGGLGREERERVIAGAIIANPRRAAKIRGRLVVLVDDVLTSGATSGACVDALLGAGAARVQIACFARVVAAHERALGSYSRLKEGAYTIDYAQRKRPEP